MSEKQLQAAVIQTARLLGWMVYHTYDSRRSQPGFPDLFMVKPGSGMAPFAVELKAKGRKPTPEQREWLDALDDAGCHAVVWTPADWESGRIERELRMFGVRAVVLDHGDDKTVSWHHTSCKEAAGGG